jgi:hypothetical protein
MPKNLKIDFSDAKQDRSQKTLDDLLQAAYEIVEAANTKSFTSRSLASKAGYSLGTLSQRLGSVEDVFFWAIQKGREIKLNDYAKAVSQFDPQLSVRDFVENFVEKAFSFIGIVGPTVMRFYDERFTKKYGLTTDYFDYTNVVADAYFEMHTRNETNTFRILSQDEIRIIFKASLALLERPFAAEDPIAGSAEHRRIAVTAITGMLAK